MQCSKFDGDSTGQFCTGVGNHTVLRHLRCANGPRIVLHIRWSGGASDREEPRVVDQVKGILWIHGRRPAGGGPRAQGREWWISDDFTRARHAPS